MTDTKCAMCERKMNAEDIRDGWQPLEDKTYCRECVANGLKKMALALKALKIFGRN